MMIPIGSSEVRKLVMGVFTQLGVGDAAEETLVVDRGRYVARSYRVGDLMAMWLLEARVVQFYDADGNLLQTLDLSEQPTALRAAA